MLRIIIFLSLLCFSSYSLATDKPTAYASCNAWYSSANVIYKNSYSLGCQESGNSFRPQQPSGSFDASRYWSFTVSCDDSSKTYFSTTHLCGVTCPDGSTAPTQAECTVTCNYTPNITTVGSTQTIHWQTLNSASNVCVDNSVSCSSPLVANVEHKRCDLQCDDGSIVDVSSGAQCPPPTCVGGQTLNTSTNRCEDPSCTAQQYLDPASHTCLNEPNCVGGQTLNRLNVPHVCDDPVCTAPEVLNVTTKVCSKPPPPECKGAQYLNSDSTACIDPVCPTGFHLNADKICEFTPNCPPYSVKTMVGGVLKCADTPTNTESRTTESPTSTETTTKQNPDGTTTTTTQTPGTTSQTRTNPDGSTTTTTTVPGKTSTTDCPDCAKESTLRDIAKNLSSTTGLGNYSSVTNTTEKGNFDDSIADAQAALDENKDALTAKMAEVKTGVSSLFSDSVSGGGGSLPTIDLGNMKGVNVSQDLNKFSPELSVVGTIIIAMAWVMALSITLSR